MFNKKNLIVALSLAGMACGMANVAHAADSVDLHVKGTLTLGSCTPVFDNNGTVDFGKHTVSDLSATGVNDLGVKSTNLTITCTDAARPVGFTVTDDKADSEVTAGLGPVSGTQAFGLGQTTAGVNLGSYSINVSSVSVDGNVGDVISSADGSTWSKPSNGLVANTGDTTWSAAAAGADTVAEPGSTFVYGINVDAVLQDTATLNITDDQNLDGQATFTLVYL